MSRRSKVDLTPYLNGLLTVPEITQLTGVNHDSVREFATRHKLQFKRLRQTEFRSEVIRIPSYIHKWLASESDTSGVTISRMIRSILIDAYNEENPPPDNQAGRG